MIMGIGAFYGGMAQFVAGIYEIKKANTFSGTVFCSFGVFWLSFCAMMSGSSFLGVDPPSTKAAAIFYLFWASFSGFMFLGSMKQCHITIKILFLTWALTLLLLCIASLAEKTAVKK